MDTNKKIKIGALLGALLIFSAFGLRSCGNDPEEQQVKEPVTLEYWRVFDDSSVFEPLIEQYEAQNPHVTINYRKLTFAEYERTVVNALAAGKGPDIWSIHNTWLPKHKEKLSTAPQELIPLQAYEETFVPVAYDDFTDINNNLEIPQRGVYGIPLSTDTLALYYNKDLLNSAFIISPPKTWTEFTEAIRSLTKTDEIGNITLAGAALGTASNVNRAPDILSLLMLQNGTQMISDDGGSVAFTSSNVTSDGEEYFPGLDALQFYTDFANPRKAIFTWTPTQANSIDAFIAEESAMMINYSYQQANIEDKAPKLNYGVAAVPQIANTPKQVDFANYWAEAVSESSKNKEEAWNFLAFLGQKENSLQYVEATGRPGARKDIIAEQAEDPMLNVFATQALTAKSWKQPDAAAVDSVFADMIESVVLGESEPEDALGVAAQKINALIIQ